MRKILLGWAAVKILLIAVFWSVAFSGCRSAELALDHSSTAPTVSPTAVIATEDAVDRPTSEPYKGDLSIFEDEERARKLQINRVMDILEIADGKIVADLGAGSGWFTVLAARKVGENGKVYAVEINEEAIKHISERAAKENFENIVTVLGKDDNPMLPQREIDVVLILKTYHEIAQPIALLKNLRNSLKKTALVGIIDRNGTSDSHGVKEETVIEEAKRAGFVLRARHEFVKDDGMDYFLVFRLAEYSGQ